MPPDAHKSAFVTVEAGQSGRKAANGMTGELSHSAACTHHYCARRMAQELAACQPRGLSTELILPTKASSPVSVCRRLVGRRQIFGQ